MQTLISKLTSALPIIIIGILLYAGLFIKPKVVTEAVEPPIISHRDYYYGVSVPESMLIWACGNNGKIIHSADAGRTWEVQASSTENNLQSIEAWDAERLIAVGNEGDVIITTDGGKTWKQADVPRSEIANKLLRVRIFDKDVWAVGEMGAVLKSTDYGLTWKRMLAEEDQAYNDIYINDQFGCIVGEYLEWGSKNIKLTHDGGKTWQGVPIDWEISLMSVTFKDKLNGVIAGLEGTILVTRDGGKTWKKMPPQTIEHLFSIIWDGSNWIAVGNKGQMVTGNAAGDVWKAKRMAAWDLSWYTDLKRVESRIYVSGGAIGFLEKGELKLFGRNF